MDYYKILGVPRNANEEEIKKAYKRAAIINHPDKGGDPEKFKEISRAKEVLLDKDQRRLYDLYGEKGLNNGGNTNNIPKGNPIAHKVNVTLQDLYTGKTMRFNINRNIICKTCDGKGCNFGCSKVCTLCNGSKYNIQTVQMGGMIQQMQLPCIKCDAIGESFDFKDKCTVCDGKRVVTEKKMLTLNIEKGMKDNQQIIFTGEADEVPNMIPGDMIFVITEQPNDTFIRNGDDLTIKQSIKLVDALCGFQITVKHLDGRILQIKTRPGEIISPINFKCIPNEGMPILQSDKRGMLKIQFDIKFPDPGYLTEDAIISLKKYLPPSELPSIDYPNMVKYCLSNYEEKKKEQQRRFKVSSDGQYNTQCPQQ